MRILTLHEKLKSQPSQDHPPVNRKPQNSKFVKYLLDKDKDKVKQRFRQRTPDEIRIRQQRDEENEEATEE